MVRLLFAFALASSAAHALARNPDPDGGRDLAAACASCHGTNGVSQAGIPGLAGRDRSEIAQLMRDFRSGKRPATVMHQIAKGYGDDQIEAIAAYLSAQKAK